MEEWRDGQNEMVVEVDEMVKHTANYEEAALPSRIKELQIVVEFNGWTISAGGCVIRNQMLGSNQSLGGPRLRHLRDPLRTRGGTCDRNSIAKLLVTSA